MKRRNGYHLKLPAALVLSALCAGAQTQPPPPELAHLRAAFSESIAAGDRAVHQQFAATLAREEKRWADAGDFATAAQLRALLDISTSKGGTGDGRASYSVDVTSSKNRGSGLATPEAGNIKFTSPGAFLEWELNGEFKGWYEVMLTHGVDGGGDYTADIKPVSSMAPAERRQRDSGDYAPKCGGWLAFDRISTLDRSAVTLYRELVSTGGWNTMRRVSMGRLELSGSNLRLRLTAKEALPRGLMNFKSLELVASSAPAGAGSGGERDLDEARKTFASAFITGTADTNNAYRDALQRMGATQKDPDVSARIKRELERLEQPATLAFSSDEGSGLNGDFKLPAGSGIDWKPRGEVRYDTTNKRFINLRPAGTGAIAWRLAAFNVPSGRYSVVVNGRAPVNGGGTGSLAASGPGNATGKALEFKVDAVVSPANRNKKPEEGSSPPQPERRIIEAGSLVIPRGAEYLTLTVQSLTHQDGTLLELSSITLTRTGDVPSPK